jgi:hypothetical protein
MKILNVFANILLLAIAHLTLAFLKVLARVQSRTQSNACARARMALALGKLTTGTPKFRGSGSLSACTIDKR